MSFQPTVHMNGTSRQELIFQQLEVMKAIRVLMGAMRKATPNGRDYYPQNEFAGLMARQQWAASYNDVNKLYEACEARALKIQEVQS